MVTLRQPDTSIYEAMQGTTGDLSGEPVAPHATWRELHVSEHVAQFYETDEFLLNALSGFIGTGLSAGEAAVVVATPPHRAGLEERLRAYGLDVAGARAAGQYIALDAAEMLPKFMRDGSLEPERFAEVFGGIIRQAAQRWPRVRIFGEMVALLWSQGQYDAAIGLEGLWNKLHETHPFLLFCAYPLNGFAESALARPLSDVCFAHSRVIPAESYTTLISPDDRLRAIILLQQKALLLQAEIAERQAVEHALRAVKEELEIQVEDLRRLHEMSVNLTSTLDIEEVLREVLRAALAVQGTSLGLLSLCDPERDGLNLKVSSGFDETFLGAVEQVPPGGGACGTCYKLRRRVVVEDVEGDPIFAPYREAARQAGFRACHSTPLITREGHIIGVLSVHFRLPHRPSDREMRLMDLYARMAADFIENARLHRQVRQKLDEREQLLIREHQARADAERANRLKDQFLTVAAHELKTPLTALLGNAQAMERRARRDGSLPERETRAIHIITQQAKRLNTMITALLDVSRLELGKLKIERAPFDLCTFVRRVVEEVQLSLTRHTVECSSPDESLLLYGDELRLEQVLHNLIGNAVKYSFNGGCVQVRVSQQGNSACIAVADQGMGIPAGDLPHLFERFYRASNADEQHISGMGIGLYVVKEIITLHDGTVEVESHEGTGSTFTVRLPIAQEHHPA